jgi:signal transduction histidine kinase
MQRLTGLRRWRRPRADQVDLALAPVLVVWFELQAALASDVGPNRVLAGLIGGVVCAGIAFRRQHPMVVGVVTQLVLSLTVNHVHLGFGPVTVGWFCALYGLAVWTGPRQFAVAVPFVVLANAGTDLWRDPAAPGVGFGVGAALAMLLVRVAVGGRDRALRLAERERDVAAREAVVEERARIARELHDVIAHHVSTMVVQAGAERRVLPPEREDTREVLGTIEDVGRGALTEMRRMVSMLRADPADDLTPQPTLQDVSELVDQMSAAGLPVELNLSGEPRQLPEGIGLSAYRIVQEALTNALKHSGGARVVVDVHYGPDLLELQVRDEGRHQGPPQVDGGGHGLVGMRERVALYGGRLEAGRQEGGGYAVRVLLPVR